MEARHAKEEYLIANNCSAVEHATAREIEPQWFDNRRGSLVYYDDGLL